MNTFLQGYPGWAGATIAVMLALVVAWVVAGALARLVRLTVLAVISRADLAMRAAVDRPVRLVRFTLWVVLGALFAFPALELSGHHVTVGVRPEALVTWMLGAGLRIVVIAVLAWLVIRIVGTVVSRMEQELNRVASPEALERARRVRTLGSLVYHAVAVVVAGSATLMILHELNVDIMPLLTGAGVLGLAVGFGAQALVKDIISGFFLILEDQVRVGDAAMINNTGGVVEAITLRTVVLRDAEGTVHVFPNGSITTLANRSKDFAYYVIDVGVAYREDTDRVADVLREVGDELRADARFAPSILEPLEVLGIDAFLDSAVTMKCRIKTRPLKQWEVGRELRRRIKLAFDAHDIEIPFPQRTVLVRTTPSEGTMRGGEQATTDARR